MKKECCKNPVCGGSGNCDTCRWKKFIIENSESVERAKHLEKMTDTSADSDYYLTVDLGTTTLVFQLMEKGTKKCVHTVTSLNSQYRYGADVISRIQAATQGKAEELCACITKDLRDGIAKITEESGICRERIAKIVIAGNTTMIHLLMGYDSSSLGKYPFVPVNLNMICEPLDVILQTENVIAEKKRNPAVTIFPGVSAFVGGDVVSGMYALDFDKKNEISLLIDLGTNGEIALGNKNRILVTSTAAGPAFECGSIGWGSEMIETAALLLENGIMDETGLLADEYFDKGYPMTYTEEGEQICFTQKDIRSLQLAKAAIRAGVETLLLRYGVTVEQISKVYIAGGFGYFLNTEKAAVIGMLSKEMALKAETVGNSSLAGVYKFLYDDGGSKAIDTIKAVSQEIVLAEDSAFNDFYMNSMLFE